MENWKNTDLSFEERAADLVSKMTLEEKAYQVGNRAAAIPRLGLRSYNYWSEASHGVTGIFHTEEMDVTSFPVCLAMSQSWNKRIIFKVASAISDEARAFYNKTGSEMCYWCPTINLGRDPRWGRNDECFGEDPYLAGKLSASYIRGIQGDDSKYLKAVSTPKHYAANNSEYNRQTGTSNMDEATLREYYTKVFSYAIQEGKAYSIMTSYNRINGVPASISDKLLTELLRQEWGFEGFVVSDCQAVEVTYGTLPMFGPSRDLRGHFYAKSLEEASAMTLIAGTDMSCGSEHERALVNAVNQGLISEDIVNRALIRALSARFKMGEFDNPSDVPYHTINETCTEESRKLAIDVAKESFVLLKNDGTLPIDISKNKNILVVGPNALYRQLGGYSCGEMGSPANTTVNVTPLDGIAALAKDSGCKVSFEKGWNHATKKPLFDMPELLPGAELPPEIPPEFAAMLKRPKKWVVEDPDKGISDDVLMDRAVEAAKTADMVIVIAGTDATVNSEERDRDTLALPYNQDENIQRILAANPNTVVCLVAGGPVTGKFIDKVPALVATYFAGQEQGIAIADALFGKCDFTGRLNQTWYLSDDDLPHISQYGIRKYDTSTMKGRTYQYFTDKVMFPFGYGLSYTKFEYSNFKVDKDAYDANETVKVSVDITNTGVMAGAEIVELYIRKETPEGMFDNKPYRQLKGFDKVWLMPNETKTVTLEVPLDDVTFWSYLKKRMVVCPGQYTIWLGKDCLDENKLFEKTIEVTGELRAKLNHVSLDIEKYVMNIGDTAKLIPAATLTDTQHLCMCEYKPTYTASNPDVIEITECGKVIAKASGTSLVVASVTYDGVTKTAKVPVCVK